MKELGNVVATEKKKKIQKAIPFVVGCGERIHGVGDHR